MAKQSEAVLEEQLVAQLQKLGYASVIIKDENALVANLKTQLEKHNHCVFSKTEFEKVMNLWSKSPKVERIWRLQKRFYLSIL